MSEPRDRLNAAVAGRYSLERELGDDVSSDGDRFLMIKPPPERVRPRVNVVLNWFEELRAKVPR